VARNDCNGRQRPHCLRKAVGGFDSIGEGGQVGVHERHFVMWGGGVWLGCAVFCVWHVVFVTFANFPLQGLRQQRELLRQQGRIEDSKKVALLIVDAAPGHRAHKRGIARRVALLEKDLASNS
jgi:hypothetical protein